MSRVTLTMTDALWGRLRQHLFPGDHDEHGAVIAAGVAWTERGVRLVARELFIARDGIDYVSSPRAYRMLTPEFVRDRVRYCRDQRLAYLAVHCHGGVESVGFSNPDLASHERGYPALVDILRGMPVGGLVFAKEAVAGDIWFADGSRRDLDHARIIGANLRDLYPSPARRQHVDPARVRQALLIGEAGQALLQDTRVVIVGLGGVGSLLNQWLAHLGVGEVIGIDPDRIATSNLSRVPGSTLDDVEREWLKVEIAARVAASANPGGVFRAVARDFVDDDIAALARDVDYLFLAADTFQARLVANAIVHQYLVPGVQVGAKVTTDRATGRVERVFAVSRPMLPGHGCLWCNGLIPPARLQEEAVPSEVREALKYVDDPHVEAPSVVTLNAMAAAHAANEFLFALTGLRDEPSPLRYVEFSPTKGTVRYIEPRRDQDCPECGETIGSRFGRGDGTGLPTRLRA